MNGRAWVDLEAEDVRDMLISLVGHRFGARPEERLDEIRSDRALYARRFIRMARIRPVDTVLDLGSGCGFGTAVIAQQAGRVVACDISPAYLAFARHECSHANNIEFVQIESRDLSAISDGSIDKVISMAVFIHLNLFDIHAYFHEFARILRPGGLALIDFADMNRLFSRLLRNRNQDREFLSHAAYYREDPANLAGLMQWNSAQGIRAVARESGLRFQKRRGHKLLFRKP